MAFEGLTEKISSAFKKLRNQGRLTEADIKSAMREIRLALLEADVNFKVTKDFIKSVTEKATDHEILESLSPAQQVIQRNLKQVAQQQEGIHIGRRQVPLPFRDSLPCDGQLLCQLFL